MFKLKIQLHDRYKKLGSFVGIIFYRTAEDGSVMFWKILSYDSETEAYTRSITTNDLFGNMSYEYKNITYTHITIRDFVHRGKWKIRRHDFQIKEN